MFTVSRQCHKRLTVAAWLVYAISLILIIAGVATPTWLVEISTGQSHGLADCCSNFHCSTQRIDVKDDVDASLAVGVFGFLISVAGIIASLILNICNRQRTYVKCGFFSATIILVGGLLLIVSLIVYAARVPDHINSIIRDYCRITMRVDLGSSFGAFAAGCVGVLLAAMSLFFAVPRARQPLMVGDFVSVDTPGAAAGAALSQSQAQTAESGMVRNAENVELNRLRPVGSGGQPSVNQSFDFWDGPRVAPSAPSFDILDAPEPFHTISEQPQLHSPIPKQLEIPYEATEISSVSERPTLHSQSPELSESEYETLDEMSSYINSANEAGASSTVSSHPSTVRQSPEFSTTNLSDEYCLVEQPGSECLTSEQADEYANIEETSAEFVRSKESGGIYTNLEHTEEQVQTEYNNIEQPELNSCSIEHPVAVIQEEPEAEYVAVD